MSDRVPAEAKSPPLPETATDRLTAHFYEWERRGRGWEVWPEPVQLEPPFRPFVSHLPALRAESLPDDARRPTLGSRLAEGIRELFGPSEEKQPEPVLVEPEEPEPDFDPGPGPVTELQVSVPEGLDVSPEAAERLLLSLPEGVGIQSFELVGLSDRIVLQLVAGTAEAEDLRRQLRAYFPEAVVSAEEGFLEDRWREAQNAETALVDFGLSEEFMLPLRTFRSFTVDPLSGLVGALEGLRDGEIGVVQVLYRPVRHPWAQSVLRAVRLPTGRSRAKPFFADAPEVTKLAEEKVSRPLFAAAVRIGAKSPNPGRAWAVARSLAGALGPLKRPEGNELIPLTEVGYPRDGLEADLLARRTRRPGMLVNSEELATLVHLPSASVTSPKLERRRRTTHPAPETATEGELVLGTNEHAGSSRVVRLSEAHRLRHTYLVGATGTGKSHLMANLILQDLEAGRGVGVLDPHGDLIETVLGYVPGSRLEDVLVFDPSDTERPVGFNVLEAHSELERTLLASDLVGIFRRMSTSWGDRIETILQNAVLAFLSSEESGTLADLRRFLTDDEFRRRYLLTVRDPESRRYFEEEFPRLSGHPQGPILTRLNAFLRHPLVRRTVAQRENRLDFARIMDEGGIFFGKLSQGLLGQDNAALLGALVVAKVHQQTLARQATGRAARRPFYLYIDEFQHFTTPSMARVLEEARKYGVGLTLAHQTHAQLQRRDSELAASVLTNPATRISFRVGDRDARSLASGFAHFEPQDLQALGVGEAVARVERADWDFNLKTHPLPKIETEVAERRREKAVARSRKRYGTPREEIESLVEEAPATPYRPAERPKAAETGETPSTAGDGPEAAETTLTAPPEPPEMGRGGRDHRYLQNLIKRWAQGRGWRAQVEAPVLEGAGSVDVSLKRDEYALACEISVTTSPEQELSNVRKCLEAGFEEVVVVSDEEDRRERTEAYLREELSDEEGDRLHVLSPDALFELLEEREAEIQGGEQRVGGYKVNVEYETVDEAEQKTRKNVIAKVVTKAMQRLRGEDS